jgi:hypothetical protein
LSIHLEKPLHRHRLRHTRHGIVTDRDKEAGEVSAIGANL